MLIGLTNLLVSIILTYNLYANNSINNTYSINTKYTYDVPIRNSENEPMNPIYLNQYPNQYSNQYTNQYSNQYSNQYLNKYLNKYLNNYNDINSKQKQHSLLDNRSSLNKYNKILKKNIGTGSYERNTSYPFINNNSFQDNYIKRYPIRI